jgi:hypothetical protein
MGNLLKVQNNILVLTLVFGDGRDNTLRGQGNHRRQGHCGSGQMDLPKAEKPGYRIFRE